MTTDDADPDDRREESPDENEDAVDDASADDAEPRDVPIEDASADEADSSDRGSTDGPEPESADGPESESDGGDESRINVSASGAGSGSGRDTGADADGEDDGGHWLSSLLSALERLESGSTSGQRRTDRTVLDYDISVRSGEEVTDDSRFDRERFGGGSGDDRDRPSSGDGRSRKRRRRSAGTPAEGLLTTRRHEDELLVTADVAGTDPDDVTVGFDDSTLVVAVSGSELDRVEVPWPDRASEATIKNGVLSVHIEPATDGSATTETEGEDDDE